MNIKTNWAPSFNHGGVHPDKGINTVYFSVAMVKGNGSLSGYLPPAEFASMAQEFGVSSEVVASAIEPTEVEDREPPEPDGECFRGGEAAAYLAESQDRIQRELKR